MQPSTPQFGSGSQALGDTDALRQAMEKRNGQASPLQQQGSNSAGYTPGLAQPQLPTPQASPATAPTAQPGQAALMGAPAPTANTDQENQLLIKALSKKLSDNSGLAKLQLGGQ